MDLWSYIHVMPILGGSEIDCSSAMVGDFNEIIIVHFYSFKMLQFYQMEATWNGFSVLLGSSSLNLSFHLLLAQGGTIFYGITIIVLAVISQA